MLYTSSDQWLRGKVHKHNNMRTHEQCKSSENNQAILAHVDVVMYIDLHLKRLSI